MEKCILLVVTSPLLLNKDPVGLDLRRASQNADRKICRSGERWRRCGGRRCWRCGSGAIDGGMWPYQMDLNLMGTLW